MGKNIINLTQESEAILSIVKAKAIRAGIDVSNNEKLVNYAISLLNDKL